jgi:hypothetical protein
VGIMGRVRGRRGGGFDLVWIDLIWFGLVWCG